MDDTTEVHWELRTQWRGWHLVPKAGSVCDSVFPVRGKIGLGSPLQVCGLPDRLAAMGQTASFGDDVSAKGFGEVCRT